ncbi:penicillin-binding protein 1C [Janthinobacterium sp. B9-8]|uniref:penicillin-binding protein 1C n=1 Tax=Janthinobacterium sp. B9-8 TaxID=1236179 RepID=UPI000A70C487|nr:penicillin-binding protein 1C [Janthinobacterium sp. B9-8]
MLKHRLFKRFILTLLILSPLVLIRLWPHESLAVAGSTAVLAQDGKLLRLTLAPDQRYRLWLPLEEFSPTLIDALKLQEDRWFYYHPGINPISLLRAITATYGGGAKQGASTLTMQLARLKYRLNTKSPSGKLRQIGLALWLEARYSKHDILEAYLNLAPYGRNIEGAAAASLSYFGKPAKALTLPESLTLAVIPQQPNQRLGSGASLTDARQRLWQRWQQRYTVSPEQIRLMTLPLPVKRLEQLPFRAPHWVEQRLADTPQQSTLNTTLDLQLQTLMEKQIRQYLAQSSTRGIVNASAMLVDTRDQSVRALVGSADYFNASIAGQVNGTEAKRSPGSTLKPFIYALGLDQGVIHPQSILRDTPSAFGPYQPENFDGRFVGPLSATEALIKSRNIPAVWLASQLKNPSFYDFLQLAGISKLKSENHYGLALVLGGGEVSMVELAGLYTMLMNEGRLKPLRYLKENPKPRGEVLFSPEASGRALSKLSKSPRADGEVLLSPEASWLALDMLSKNPRPDGGSNAWPVAFKTGTSWGFRDAWTAGVVGPYVLVVWLGNFDGQGNPALIGLEAAAPLFFRISDALALAKPADKPLPRNPPMGLKRINICTASGDLPNAFCPQQSSTWFIPGKSPIRVSSLHQPVHIDTRSGLAVCPPYDAHTKTEVFEFWSSDMARLFKEAGVPRRKPPHIDCSGMASLGDAPKISSPLAGLSYTLRLSKPDETIALQAAASSEQLYWFDNQIYLGSAKASGLAWRPQAGGWHQLSVVDDQGRSDSRQVKVELLP